MGSGTIVDATIISAPSSTKNAQRDAEMHQTKKGQRWHFGMKLHIGVDSKTGLAHSAVVTPANTRDKQLLPQLLHGQERQMYGDSAYAGRQQLIHAKAPRAVGRTNQRVRKGSPLVDLARTVNRSKSRVRARVEHIFAVVKRLWGFDKVRPEVGQKCHAIPFEALGQANIFLAKKVLYGQVRQ